MAADLRPGVVAVVVTHRRPAELQRLLESLAASTYPLLGCVVSDHAPTGEINAIAAKAPFETIVLEDASNPGPGTGWANAAKKALHHFGDGVSAIWYLDDDVVVPLDALEILWTEMTRAGAWVIAPLLEDQDGRLWAFPEPLVPSLRKAIRRVATPSEARKELGDNPIPFCWCTGACVLVKKSAVETAGLHRGDFWMLGEDLEYSMRLAAGEKAVFTCQVSVRHLPPPARDPAGARRADYLKFCSLLQNLSYLSFHVPYSHHMKSYLPGNFHRFLRSHGLNSRTLRDAATCWWNGAIRGRPSGTPSGEALRNRITNHERGN